MNASLPAGPCSAPGVPTTEHGHGNGASTGTETPWPPPWPPPPNPLVNRPKLIEEANRLARQIAIRTGGAHATVIAEASRWNGRSQRLWVMTDDRLAHTYCTLASWWRRLNGTPEPVSPMHAQDEARRRS